MRPLSVLVAIAVACASIAVAPPAGASTGPVGSPLVANDSSSPQPPRANPGSGPYASASNLPRANLDPIGIPPLPAGLTGAGSPATPGLSGATLAVQPVGGFSDVSEDRYYSQAVADLATWGVLAGTECDEGFCPDREIDRKTMAVWVVRVLDGEDPPPVRRSRFGDVDVGSFHGPFIERMAELEVTSGCGQGTDFCPHVSVTRAEMAVFLSRAYDLADGPDPGFADVGADAWYAADVARLAWSGITSGCGDGTVFCANQPTTRAQTAAFLWRAETRFGRDSEEVDPRTASVSLSAGDSARGVFDEDGDNCRSVHCRWLRIDAQALGPGPYVVECWHEAFGGFPRAPFVATTVSALPTEDVCFFGFADVRVWAVVDGVKSNEVNWPHGEEKLEVQGPSRADTSRRVNGDEWWRNALGALENIDAHPDLYPEHVGDSSPGSFWGQKEDPEGLYGRDHMNAYHYTYGNDDPERTNWANWVFRDVSQERHTQYDVWVWVPQDHAKAQVRYKVHLHKCHRPLGSFPVLDQAQHHGWVKVGRVSLGHLKKPPSDIVTIEVNDNEVDDPARWVADPESAIGVDDVLLVTGGGIGWDAVNSNHLITDERCYGDMSKGQVHWLQNGCPLRIPESPEAWRKRCLEIWAENNPPPHQIHDPFDLYKGPSDYRNLASIHSVLEYPDIRAGNFNGKKSYVYPHAEWGGSLIREGWNGRSHSYACGVKDSFSTYATYDFGRVESTGRYRVFAYYPGDRESHTLRNDGHGSFSILVNWQEQHRYTQYVQSGGWIPIEVSKDDSSIHLTQGSRIRINILNGDHDRQGRCANGARVVFPPLLLVNSSRYNLEDFRPFDPARDVNPITLSLFATCMSIPLEPGSTLDSSLERNALIISMVASIIGTIPEYGISLTNPIPGVPGNIGFDLGLSLTKLDDQERAKRLANRCDNAQLGSSYRCKVPVTLLWQEPVISIDASTLGRDSPFPDRIGDPLHPLGVEGRAGYHYTYNGLLYEFESGYGSSDCDERPLLDQDAHDIFKDENGIMWVRSDWATTMCTMDDGQRRHRIEAPDALLGTRLRQCID